VGLYFFRTADMVNRRWGTPSPITYDDPKYNFPVGLGAFGNYSMRITKAQEFFVNVVAATSPYTVKELQRIILSRITQPMTDFLAKAKFSYAEIDANRSEPKPRNTASRATPCSHTKITSRPLKPVGKKKSAMLGAPPKIWSTTRWISSKSR
jgi:hypothetical protein